MTDSDLLPMWTKFLIESDNYQDAALLLVRFALEKQTWQPLPNGVYPIGEYDKIAIDDALIGVYAGRATAFIELPENIRLCRKGNA